MSPLIVCNKIEKIYGSGEALVRALHGIDLKIERKENIAIKGPSGSGKSTLLQILGCLDRPSSGSYCLDGIAVQSLSDDALSQLRAQKIGFVFQAFHLFPRLSLLENVALPLFYHKVPKADRLARAEIALSKVKLSHRATHRPNEVSGGEKQRAAIARALVHSPEIIFADEPTGNLDTKVKCEILDLLQQLNEQESVTLITVTHDEETAKRAKRVLSIRDGDIVGDDRQ